eukprot:2786973-Rhodomonas_salina.1
MSFSIRSTWVINIRRQPAPCRIRNKQDETACRETRRTQSSSSGRSGSSESERPGAHGLTISFQSQLGKRLALIMPAVQQFQVLDPLVSNHLHRKASLKLAKIMETSDRRFQHSLDVAARAWGLCYLPTSKTPNRDDHFQRLVRPYTISAPSLAQDVCGQTAVPWPRLFAAGTRTKYPPLSALFARTSETLRCQGLKLRKLESMDDISALVWNCQRLVHHRGDSLSGMGIGST